MTPYGGDRVRVDGERIFLSCRLPKGWVARVERTLTQSEFPGTAVLWDEQFYEVVGMEPIPSGVRYALQLWEEHHAIRVSVRYDEESETQRAIEWRAALSREAKRQTVGVMALFTGHLPAIVQERLAHEVGILAARLTFYSILSQWLVVALLVMFMVTRIMAQEALPLWALLLAAYLFVENGFRFLINWTQTRPMGSTMGVIVYILYWLITGMHEQATPFAQLKGHKVTITEAPPDQQLSDAMATREALATLLPVRDQERLRERYGYDYRRSAQVVAGILMIFAILGIVTSIMNGAIVSLIAATAVALEQLFRFIAFRRGPASSVLGWVVRPLMRGLL